MISTDPKPEVVKPGWGECPPADLALRKTVPQFRAETQARLTRWASGQPVAVMAWVCDRAEGGYFKQGVAEVKLCMAVAALDLLRWQTGCEDKVALEKLMP